MREKVTIAASGLLVSLLTLKIYFDSMPAFGIKSWRKKLLLNHLVTDYVPKISIGDALVKENVLFLDTRSKDEYNVSHIEGARFMGYSEFSLEQVKDIPKVQSIIAYCRIGKRSGEIGKRLLETGFKNVQSLYGGIFEWVHNG